MTRARRYPRALCLATLALAAAAATAGCGSSKHPAASLSPSTASTATSTLGSVSGPLDKEPMIVPPSGPPPTHLVTKDIVTGTGTAATAGDTVTIAYEGVNYANGQVFDASWTDGSGAPITDPLSMFVPGFRQGIVGMKVGGRREIIIPPALGYGSAGSGPIGPNETLIFVVDLVSIGGSSQ